MSAWIQILLGLALGVGLVSVDTFYFQRKLKNYWLGPLLWALWCSTFFFIFTLDGGGFLVRLWLWVLAIFYWWLFWKNWPRNKKDKAKELIGAKTKALRDKLVATMPGMKPRPAGIQA